MAKVDHVPTVALVPEDSTGGAVNSEQRLDTDGLGRMLRDRRGTLSLRQAAQDAGLSFSTFSRVEAGSQPDLASFIKLCTWLGVSPSFFFTEGAEREPDPVEVAIAHLHADPRLSESSADQIADVLRRMYEALASPPIPVTGLACHLRAASTLRPGVADRLGRLLQSIDDELRRRTQLGTL